MDNTNLLQRHKLKSTPQRLEIIKVLETNGHLNIHGIYEKLKKKFPSVSLSTIYKNINTMSEKGFLSEVKLDGQKSVYELIKKHHSHVVCTECKSVRDIEVDTSDILSKAKNVSQYDLGLSSLIFYGLCPNCIKN